MSKLSDDLRSDLARAFDDNAAPIETADALPLEAREIKFFESVNLSPDEWATQARIFQTTMARLVSKLLANAVEPGTVSSEEISTLSDIVFATTQGKSLWPENLKKLGAFLDAK